MQQHARGAQSEEISETIEIAIEAATEQAEQEGRELQLYFVEEVHFIVRRNDQPRLQATLQLQRRA